MCRLIFYLICFLVLFGCQNRHGSLKEAGTNQAKIVESGVMLPENLPITVPLPVPPKITVFDWTTSIHTLVADMLQQSIIIQNALLLIDDTYNQTNENFQTTSITKTFKQVLLQQQKFRLISDDQILVAKKQLGLTEGDQLNSLSKSISLAKILHAKYVMYSMLTGNLSSLQLDVRLLSVDDGAITWSGVYALTQ